MQTSATPEKRYVGIKEIACYGVACGGQNIGYNMVRSQLTFFLVTVFGIPSQAVATMIFAMGLWDAFNDPIMGSLVDRTRSRYGKLRPYLMIVPIPLGISTIVFFGGAKFLENVESIPLKIVYMCITYFVWEIFYTIGDIPYWGLSAAISPNPADRSKAITSARFVSSIIGGLPNLIIPICIDLSRNGKIPLQMNEVFLVLAILAGTVGMGLFSLAGFCTKERIVQTSQEPGIFDCFKYLFKNKPLLLLVTSSVLGTVGGIADTFTQYYYTFSLGMASLTLLAGIPGTVMGFFTYLLMPVIEKTDSKKLIIRMTFMKAIVTTVIFLLGSRSYTNAKVIVPLLAIQGVFNSIFSSISMVIPTKMIGDTVDYMEWKTNERSEGMTFSLLTFISKLTGSLSTAIATAVIPLIGLQQVGSDMVLAADTGVNTRFWLWGLVTAIPAVLNLISLVPYAFYKLDKNTLSTIHEDLRMRRESAPQEVE